MPKKLKLTAPQIALLKYCADPVNEPSPLLTAGQRGAPNSSTWDAVRRRGLVVDGFAGGGWPGNRSFLTVEGEAALLEATGIVAPPVVCTCWQTERWGPHRPDGEHWFLAPVDPSNYLGDHHWVRRQGSV